MAEYWSSYFFACLWTEPNAWPVKELLSEFTVNNGALITGNPEGLR